MSEPFTPDHQAVPALTREEIESVMSLTLGELDAGERGLYVPLWKLAGLCRMALRAEELERVLTEVALRYRVNTDPVKCHHCGAEVAVFAGSIVGPSCERCRRQMRMNAYDC